MATEARQTEHLRRVAVASDASTRERGWDVWFGVFGGPLAWGAHLLVSYGLDAWFICDLGGRLTLVGVTLVAAALAAAATFFAWRGWARSPDDADAGLHGTGGANGFLGYLGISLGLLSLLGIVYHGVTIFYFDPCG